jgi:hypothetical protein
VRKLRHRVTQAAPPIDPDPLESAFDVMWSVGLAYGMEDWAVRLGRPLTPDLVEPLACAVYQMGWGAVWRRLPDGV